MEPSRRICHVCTSRQSRYTCPKCLVTYCSVDCFQKHAKACTETFYREQVESHVDFDRYPNFSAARKWDDSPVELHNPDSSMQASHVSPIELDELRNDGITYEQLPTHIRWKFQKAVASGSLSKYIAMWKPWWEYTVATYRHICKLKFKPLILEKIFLNPTHPSDLSLANQPTYKDTTQQTREAELVPDVRDLQVPIPKLSQLIVEKHSIDISWDVMAVLGAYAFVMRTYNGDWLSDPLHCALLLREVTHPLQHSSHIHYEDASGFLNNFFPCIARVQHLNCIRDSAELCSVILRDIQPILGSVSYMRAALFDAYCICSNALKTLIADEYNEVLEEGSKRHKVGAPYTVAQLHRVMKDMNRRTRKFRMPAGERSHLKGTLRQLHSMQHKLWFMIVWCTETPPVGPDIDHLRFEFLRGVKRYVTENELGQWMRNVGNDHWNFNAIAGNHGGRVHVPLADHTNQPSLVGTTNLDDLD